MSPVLNNSVNIAVVTGSRADYGLLKPVMQALSNHPLFRLRVIVTGMHLAAEFGNTWQTIEQDGFTVDAKVPMLQAENDTVGVTKSLGTGIIGFADTLSRLQPDLLLVLGDRFEIFAAVQAALVAKIPVAHIAGGDTTEGAFDESIRHSITKMAHLHFTTNEQARQRVVQMGENPAAVFNVGSPGIDHIRALNLSDKPALSATLGIPLLQRLLVLTLHPATLDPMPVAQQCDILFTALETFTPNTTFLFTYANADTDGKTINALIDAYTAQHANAHAFASLGQQGYYSAVACADAVIGNSSSGLYEAPSLGTATVNIGMRQQGRMKAASVIDCSWNIAEIRSAIQQAINTDMSNVINPYGDGHSTEKIIQALEHVSTQTSLPGLIQKHFFMQAGHQ